MFSNTNLTNEPLFLLFIALSFMLAFGYFWGRRRNRAITIAAFDELTHLLRPKDQTYTNIGGSIGYHATYKGGKDHLFDKAEATLILLPRQSWLYLPFSLIIRRWDSLFLTLHLKQHPPAEGHLIQARYAGSRQGRITNAHRLNKEQVKWGAQSFLLYSANNNTRNHLFQLIRQAPEPGTVRHIAFLPHQKRCFIFLIPKRNRVGAMMSVLSVVFAWLPLTLEGPRQGRKKGTR